MTIQKYKYDTVFVRINGSADSFVDAKGNAALGEIRTSFKVPADLCAALIKLADDAVDKKMAEIKKALNV